MNNAKSETQPSKVPVPSGIALRGITVRAGKRILLEETGAEFPAGKISLIVGPSGVGKSILLRMMAGLIQSQSDGVNFDGEVLVDEKKAVNGAAGVVFQSFALFDELSPMANLDFAYACGGSHSSDVPADELLEQLNVPRNVPTSRLSGGQRQRLAIARTLAYNPPAILYDEPTSGLDPSTGEQVANLIRKTHHEYGKTSVIVTHDYNSLMPIADHIFLLDPTRKALVEVPPNQWEDIPERLNPMSSMAVSSSEVSKPYTRGERIQLWLKDFFVSTTGVFIAMLLGLLSFDSDLEKPEMGTSLPGTLRSFGGRTDGLVLPDGFGSHCRICHDVFYV